ncbi:MAG TPA: serine/threonine-protein kinase [Gemmatimonadaceae bacterium]|nr:serine/threonine-protein kinase [Gemmatimonadaceae bacterium]
MSSQPPAPGSQPASTDSAAQTSSSELKAHIERILGAHYELDSEIGRGGMGVVYRARDKRLKRHVAIKVLPPELAFQSAIRTRFLREAETAAQLSHPNIVPIYTVDEAEGLVFFVMAYVSGDNLAKRLHDRGVLAIEDVRRIVREVADALAYAHERGVVHRDIKPDNILLDANSNRAMVTDFGIARAVSDMDSGRLTATGMAIGTPAYMSPEQAAGDRQIDGRSDLYSLGVVAYQMLVGEPPFVANSTPAMLVKHISERPTPVTQRRSDVPSDLARAVMMCLEKEPANRFPSAGALVTALDSGHVPEPRVSAPQPEVGMVPAPVASQRVSLDTGYEDARFPTPEEQRRFEHPDVVAFRRKLAPYLFVNSVIVLATIFGKDNFFPLTVMWSIYIAYKYARLWSDGFDWRDVFRQPRERELIDVADDFLEYVRAMFNRDKRRELRDKARARRLSGRMASPVLGAGGLDMSLAASVSPESVYDAAGTHADRVRHAATDRDEILRLIGTLPERDRDRVNDVTRSANALHDRIGALAMALADLERNVVPGGAGALEQEISRLEEQANPLESGSEDRVRRLAFLKRQRRAVKDMQERRDQVASKLETCALALRQLKLDVLRLRAGAQTHQHVTSLALEAMALAENVDSALYVADEISRATARPSGRVQRSSVRPG